MKLLLVILRLPTFSILPHMIPSLLVTRISYRQPCYQGAHSVEIDPHPDYLGAEVVLAQHCSVGEPLPLARRHTHLVVL